MVAFDGTDDFFYSQDMIDRIAELEFMFAAEAPDDGIVDIALMSDDELEEYWALLDFRYEAFRAVPDWEYGVMFVADDYFEEYAREHAVDIGTITGEETWPLNHVDWAAAAAALKMDYTSFVFRGTTYWTR